MKLDSRQGEGKRGKYLVSGGEEEQRRKGGNVWRSKIFGRQRRRKTEKGKEEMIWIRKISGHFMRRRTEKENEENIWSRKIYGQCAPRTPPLPSPIKVLYLNSTSVF